MTGRVPIIPPRIVASHGSKSSLRIAAPIYGDGQHYDMALAVNKMLGYGRQLVNATPMEDVNGVLAIAPAASRDVTYWIHPNAYVKSYCWLVSLKLLGPRSFAGLTAGVTHYPSAYGEFQTDAAVKLGEWSLGGATGQQGSFEILHHAGAITDGDWTLRVVNNTGSPNSVFISGLTLMELPRGVIDEIPDAETCRTGAPIFEATDHLSALDSIVRFLPQAKETTRRAALVDFWAPGGVHITSATPATINRWVLRPRNVFGTTTRTLQWRAFAKATGGNGKLTILTEEDGGSATDTQTAVVSSSSYAYVSGTIGARTEDPSNLAAGGLRDDILEAIELQGEKDAATSIDVQGFKVWESD